MLDENTSRLEARFVELTRLYGADAAYAEKQRREIRHLRQKVISLKTSLSVRRENLTKRELNLLRRHPRYHSFVREYSAAKKTVKKLKEFVEMGDTPNSQAKTVKKLELTIKQLNDVVGQLFNRRRLANAALQTPVRGYDVEELEIANMEAQIQCLMKILHQMHPYEAELLEETTALEEENKFRTIKIQMARENLYHIPEEDCVLQLMVDYDPPSPTKERPMKNDPIISLKSVYDKTRDKISRVTTEFNDIIHEFKDVRAESEKALVSKGVKIRTLKERLSEFQSVTIDTAVLETENSSIRAQIAQIQEETGKIKSIRTRNSRSKEIIANKSRQNALRNERVEADIRKVDRLTEKNADRRRRYEEHLQSVQMLERELMELKDAVRNGERTMKNLEQKLILLAPVKST